MEGPACSSALETRAVSPAPGTQTSPHLQAVTPWRQDSSARLPQPSAGPLDEQVTLGCLEEAGSGGASEWGWGSVWGAQGCALSPWHGHRPQAGTQG